MSDVLFIDEPEESLELDDGRQHKTWKILVVDDDETVHEVTNLVLSSAEVEHRRLEMTSAFSSAEAKELLLANDDYCIAFVDVVMETEHAGLELVEWIRKDLKNKNIRLILRTGQAGSAPESRVIKDFDINDYKDKTDFTSGKMITTVYAGIRAYRDIMTIQRSLDAFKLLIKATHDLLKVRQFRQFGSAALNNLLALMDVDSSALYIARTKVDFYDECSNFIIACTGKYVCQTDDFESSDVDQNIKLLIQSAFDEKKHLVTDNYFVGYYENSTNSSSVLYIEFEDDADHFKAHLAELFATNVSLILESLAHQQEVERTQRELLYIAGDSIESRSAEKSAHVKRIAMICSLLAEKMELSADFIEAIRLGSPLHDIGKLAIPDHIIKKEEKLTERDWALIKTHPQVGFELLQKSTLGVSKLAAKLALYHHENWDGSGYPEGLSGTDIPMEARIMAVADVFDSLGSKRTYRDAWSEKKIIEYLTSEKSKKFDPELIDIVLNNQDEFLTIRTNYPDI
jgi:response regulator RpfG family c-di-GMP phosphodiesterase